MRMAHKKLRKHEVLQVNGIPHWMNFKCKKYYFDAKKTEE